MNGDTRSCVDQILDAIEYGRLPIDETERRVQNLLDNEVSKTTEAADMDMVNACQSLLWELKTHGQIPYEDHSEQIRASVEKEYSSWMRHHQRQQLAIKIGSAGAVFLLVVGISLSLHWEWFSGNSTPDNQQYFVQGHEISTEMVAEALAGHDAFAQYEGDNMDELETYLGFQPNIPQRLENELFATRYSILFLPTEIQLNVFYTKSLDAPYELSYSIHYFTQINDAYISMEQSERGEYVEICGYHVYITNNLEHQLACWQIDNSMHVLLINTPDENIETVITEFIGGTYQ